MLKALKVLSVISLCVGVAWAEDHELKVYNQHEDKLDIVIVDENSTGNKLSLAVEPGQIRTLNLGKIFNGNVKTVSIIGKGNTPTLTNANKCSNLSLDKSYKVSFTAGSLKTVKCSATQGEG